MRRRNKKLISITARKLLKINEFIKKTRRYKPKNEDI